ncbi:DNA polymerase III subunit beta [Parvularcula bermudensis HTCC2503]|uniref:Beta sliding clamp n=1 Tax=Parvularcula bermudensis (strain ATCC BAA-594 / HTCC2503 / KCTC 12087) TaxID=314260 RepID=E0TBJ7_PARBH|nr:DNA polymerase III subunit beta [Parvularcula bermudensis]ADM08372.1 DNA polymerase III subunit beta [Parvularcula bermudensis HTCC2503]
MQVTIERATLLKALHHTQSVVERRNTIPILSNVLMRAQGGSLALTATDLDIEIAETVPAEIAEEGGVTASAVTLYDIVKRLPDGGQISLNKSSGSSRLMLKSGRSEFQLSILPDDDFPTLSDEAAGATFTISADALGRLLDRTRFAMSQEETRYYLNGVYLHALTEGEGAPSLRAVATDGHRLARLDSPLPPGAEAIPGVIIPRKAVLELRRLLDDADGDVAVTVTPAKIRFAFGDIVLVSKLIDGTFPDYQRVIPSGNDRVMKVDNDAFRRAVDRVSTVSADKTRSVKLSLTEDQLTLLVNNPETGSATDELSVDFKSTDLEVGFNARYLLDIADQISGETAVFHFADAASPTLVTDEEDEGALYVLMPLRV